MKSTKRVSLIIMFGLAAMSLIALSGCKSGFQPVASKANQDTAKCVVRQAASFNSKLDASDCNDSRFYSLDVTLFSEQLPPAVEPEVDTPEACVKFEGRVECLRVERTSYSTLEAAQRDPSRQNSIEYNHSDFRAVLKNRAGKVLKVSASEKSFQDAVNGALDECHRQAGEN